MYHSIEALVSFIVVREKLFQETNGHLSLGRTPSSQERYSVDLKPREAN